MTHQVAVDRSIKDSPKPLSALITIVCICILIGSIVRIAGVEPLTNDPLVLAPFHDDGFYYLEIARNVATTGIFTFDRINRTNGFHPLWQLLLAPIALILMDDFAFIRLVMYFSILLFAFTGFLLFKFVSSYGGIVAGLAAVILWSFSPDLIMWQNQGMENTIFLPLLLLALIQIDRFTRKQNSLYEATLLGCIFGLTMWARSDSFLFVILALGGLLALNIRENGFNFIRNVYPGVIVVGIVFFSGIGYLLFNDYAAGSIFSVSGVVKIIDNANNLWNFSQTVDALKLHLSMIWHLFDDFGGLMWFSLNWRILPFKIVSFFWIVIVLFWWGSHLIRENKWIIQEIHLERGLGLELLLIYTFLHTIILVTLLRNILRWTPWYLVPQVLLFVVVVPLVLFPKRMVRFVSQREKWAIDLFAKKVSLVDGRSSKKLVIHQAGNLTIFAATVMVPCTWAILVPYNFWLNRTVDPKMIEPRYELAAWLNQNVSPESTIGMFDAGITGYFAQAHVVNLDGLVNSPEYVQIRRVGNYADYVINHRMDYIIYYYFPPFQMNWGHPTDDSGVCHRLVYVNKNPALWGEERVKNYFEVVALKYDGGCEGFWKPGFPLDAIPIGQTNRDSRTLDETLLETRTGRIPYKWD